MTVKEEVKNVLKNYPHTRQSDRNCILSVWWTFHQEAFTQDARGEWCIKTSKFLDLPAPETIRRYRQKFQEEGKYLPEKKVQERRKEWSEDYEYYLEKL